MFVAADVAVATRGHVCRDCHVRCYKGHPRLTRGLRKGGGGE
jgi:hypothetical protein